MIACLCVRADSARRGSTQFSFEEKKISDRGVIVVVVPWLLLVHSSHENVHMYVCMRWYILYYSMF